MRREVTEREEGVTGSAARAWAVLGVAGLALGLMLLPVLVVLAGAVRGAEVFAGAAASLAAVMGGGKLAAALWGLRAAAVPIE